MLDWFWQGIVYNLPWWVWLWLGIIVVSVFFFWARTVGGLKNALLMAGAAALAVGAGIINVRGRQRGAKDQQERDQHHANATLDKAHSARADARADNADPSGLRDDDGFRRDD